MDSEGDVLQLTYGDDETLKAALAGLQPGETLTLKVSVTVNANDDRMFEASIDEVSVMDELGEAEDEMGPEGEDPVLAVVMGDGAEE